MAEITGGELQYTSTLDINPMLDSIKNLEGRISGYSEIIAKAGDSTDVVFDKSGAALKKQAGEVRKVLDVLTDFSLELVTKQALLVEEMNKIPKDSPEYEALSQQARQLAQEIHSAAVEIPVMTKLIKDAEFASTNTAQKIVILKKEIQDLTEQNKQGTPEFERATKRLQEYDQVMKDAANTIKGMTMNPLEGMLSLLTAGSSVAAAFAGTIGLLGIKKEELAVIDDKLNSLIALAVGLQGAHATVMQADATATALVTQAKNFLAAANLRLATALGISTAAATVLMATLTVGLSVAIAGVIYLMSQYGNEAAEVSAMNKKVAESVAEPLFAYKQLQIQYNALADDMKAKEQFVIDNKEAFNKLGYEVNNVSDAEKFFVSQSANFVKAMTLRAESAAYAELAMESFKQSILDEKEYRRKYIDKDLTVGEIALQTLNGGVGGITANDQMAKDAEKIRKNKQGFIDLTAKQIKAQKEVNALVANSGIKPSGGSDGKTSVIKTTKGGATSTAPTKEEEILLDGSLAKLRAQLSDIQEAFSKTNDEITRDTLNQEKLVIEAQIKAIEDKYIIKEDEAAKEKAELEKKLQEFLVSQRNYEEKVTAIKEQYSKLRSVATTDDERSKIDAGMQADLQKLASDELKKSKAWINAFGEIEIYTAQKLAEVRAALLAELQRMEADGSATPEAVKAVQDQLKKIDIQILKSRKSFEIIKDAIRAFGDESLSTQEKIKKLSEGINAAKDVLGDLKDIVGGVKDIFTAFGGEMDSTFGDVLESIEGAIEGLEQFAEGAGQALEGFASGNMLQAAAGTIKAIGGAVKAVASFFNGDKKKEREIKKLSQNLGDLTTSYNELAFAAERAFGSQKYSGQTDLIRNLEQQKAVLQEMANAEGGKKKGDKEKIAGYQSQIQTINQSIASLKEGIIKDVLQTDIPDMAAKMGDALVEAFGRGEDGVKALENAANDMIKNLLKNQLNLALQNKMKPILDSLLAASGFNADGTGTFTGLTPEQIAAFKAQVVAAGQQMEGFLEGYSEIFGGLDSQSSSLSGAIKGITEQTAGVLAGQLNAIRLLQGENMKTQKLGLEIARSILINLSQIEQNTRPVKDVYTEIYDLNKRLKSKGF